jgi:hypothetical protein
MQLNEFIHFSDEIVGEIYEALNIIRDEDITPEIAQYSVNLYSLSLELIPDHLITEQMCWTAVHSGDCADGDAISFVPARYMSYGLAFAAVMCRDQTLPALRAVPRELIDYNLCLAAVANPVQQNYLGIEFVPDQFKDFSLCRIAISTKPDSIRFVPEKFKAELKLLM